MSVLICTVCGSNRFSGVALGTSSRPPRCMDCGTLAPYIPVEPPPTFEPPKSWKITDEDEDRNVDPD